MSVNEADYNLLVAGREESGENVEWVCLCFCSAYTQNEVSCGRGVGQVTLGVPESLGGSYVGIVWPILSLPLHHGQ